MTFTGLVGRHVPQQLAPTRGRARSHVGSVMLFARGGDDIELGAKVKAMSSEDDEWYTAVIDKVNDDGTYTVKWDDPDGGPETDTLGEDKIKVIVIFKDYKVGDDCQGQPPDDDNMYPGVVSKVNKDGTFTVKWDDPDGGPEQHDVKPDVMKKVNVFKDYKVKDVVTAKFPEDGNMYGAVVTKDVGGGVFTVKWDDPDGAPEEADVKSKDMKYPPIPFDKLEVGQKYTGQVRTILDFGAFVDIGAEGDGLLHISRIAKERVNDVSDYVEVDQEITVWISGKRDDEKFGLTMIEGIVEGAQRQPADYGPFEGVSPDDWHVGTVARIAPFGAFVQVSLNGATADGLCHISQIRDGFVDNVEDELSEGQEVKVRIQSVDAGAGKMSLSMKEGGGGGGGGGGGRTPQDVSAFEGMESKWLKGTVASRASFGAFVTVTHPDSGKTCDGLVHITQIRDGYVESVEDEMEDGQEVDVWIQSVDTFSNKMSLSMKKEEGGGEE